MSTSKLVAWSHRREAIRPSFEVHGELDGAGLIDADDHAAVAEPFGDADTALGGDFAHEGAEGAEDAAGGVVAVGGGVVGET